MSNIYQIALQIDLTQEAEQVFTTSVVEPFVASTIIPSVISDRPSSEAAASLKRMYDAILSFLDVKCAKLLELASIAFRGTQFNLLVDTVWPAIASAIISQLQGIFNPGVPEIFHAV